MAETVSIAREKVELLNGALGLHEGNSIELRKSTIKSFVGLGPPDFCVLSKSYEGTKVASLFSSKAAPVNYFHWVLGVNVSSASTIDAYFKELISKQEQLSLGGMRGAYKIEKCHYMSYNAFKRLDLNVELTADGKVDCYTLDGQGNKSTDIASSFWEELSICSVLRGLGPVPLVEPVTVRPGITSFEQEKQFLDLVAKNFWKGHELGSVDGAKPDNTNNLLAFSVYNYFMDKNRQEQLANFFSELAKKDGSVISHVAQMKLKAGLPDEALALVEKPLREMPSCGSLIVIKVNALLHQESYQQAKLVAEENLEKNVDSIDYWLTLADTYAHCEDCKASLRAINKAPIQSSGSVDRIGKPPSSRMTEPALDLQSHEIRQLEEMEFDREEGQEALMSLDSIQLSADERRAYNILLYINKEAGWKKIAEDMKVFKKKATPLAKPALLQPLSVVVDGAKQSDSKREEAEQPETKKEEVKQEDGKQEETKQEDGKQEETKQEDEIESKETQKEESTESVIPLDGAIIEMTEPLSAHLENVFNSLGRDLRVFATWKELKDQSQVTSSHIAADYVRIGLLAVRLGDVAEAEKALLRCVASQYHLEAWKLLLEVYRQQSKVRETILVVDHLLKHYGELYPTTLDPCPAANKALFDVVARHGLSKVRQVMNEITPASTSMWQMKNTGPLHLRVQNVLQETVTWNSVGSDK